MSMYRLTSWARSWRFISASIACKLAQELGENLPRSCSLCRASIGGVGFAPLLRSSSPVNRSDATSSSLRLCEIFNNRSLKAFSLDLRSGVVEAESPLRVAIGPVQSTEYRLPVDWMRHYCQISCMLLRSALATDIVSKS